MHWFGGYGSGMGHGFGWLLMILFWILVIIGIFYLVRRLSGGSGGRQEGDNALSILRERYARGDISKEEFEQMREELRR